MLTVAQVINRMQQVQPNTLPVAVDGVNEAVEFVAIGVADIGNGPEPAVVLMFASAESDILLRNDEDNGMDEDEGEGYSDVG